MTAVLSCHPISGQANHSRVVRLVYRLTLYSQVNGGIVIVMTTVIQFPSWGPAPLTELVSGEIKALMGRHDVTQMMLAAWLGLPQSSVSARLKGQARWTLPEIEKVAQGFGVHPAQLMGGYAEGPRPDPDEGLPIKRARRDSNPKPSDP